MGNSDPRSGDRLRRQHYFADFTLDLDRGVLLRGSEEIELRPKSFAVLTYFVEHHGRLLSKGVLTAALWPDLAVTDNSLPQCLVEIRRALGDDSQQMIRILVRWWTLPPDPAPRQETRLRFCMTGSFRVRAPGRGKKKSATLRPKSRAA